MDYEKAFEIYLNRSSRLAWLRLILVDSFPVFNKVDNCQIVLFYSQSNSGRPDYDYVYEKLLHILLGGGIRTLLISNTTIVSKAFFAAHVCFLYFSSVFSKKGFLEKYYDYLYQKASNILSQNRPAVLVTFCDAHPVDWIVTKCANDIGIKTVTLQHGLYFLADTVSPPLIFSNSISDFMIVWGPLSADRLMECNTHTKPVSLGSLKLSHSEITTLDNLTSKKYSGFNVYLNADDEQHSNIKMLGIVEDYCREYGSSFTIKKHPRTKVAIYKKFLTSKYFVDEVLEPVAIFCSSGVVVDLLLRAEPLLAYSQVGQPTVYPNEIIFHDVKSLDLSLRYLRLEIGRYTSTYLNLRRLFICISDPDDKHRQFFLKLLE